MELPNQKERRSSAPELGSHSRLCWYMSGAALILSVSSVSIEDRSASMLNLGRKNILADSLNCARALYRSLTNSFRIVERLLLMPIWNHPFNETDSRKTENPAI